LWNNFANELCIAFAKQDWQASFLVFRNELALHPDKLQNEIKNLIYYERTEFCETLLPYLKNNSDQGKYLSLEALSQQYSIRHAYCQNLANTAALPFILEKVHTWNIDIAITIRCIIKYDSILLSYFSRDHENYFWNIHPGLLPQYRGIMPVFGAMLNHEINFGYTLHRVSEELDNGPIIDTHSQPVDYSKSMIIIHYL
jgi:formyltetrahydrofolate hydrolase